MGDNIRPCFQSRSIGAGSHRFDNGFTVDQHDFSSQFPGSLQEHTDEIRGNMGELNTGDDFDRLGPVQIYGNLCDARNNMV